MTYISLSYIYKPFTNFNDLKIRIKYTHHKCKPDENLPSEHGHITIIQIKRYYQAPQILPLPITANLLPMGNFPTIEFPAPYIAFIKKKSVLVK